MSHWLLPDGPIEDFQIPDREWEGPRGRDRADLNGRGPEAPPTFERGTWNLERGTHYPGPGGNPPSGGNRRPPDGKKILEQLSVETGGRLFEVTKKQTLSQIFQQIQDELRHQYSIGFTPAAEAARTGFRKITLLTKKKGLTVQCRTGYYPTDR